MPYPGVVDLILLLFPSRTFSLLFWDFRVLESEDGLCPRCLVLRGEGESDVSVFSGCPGNQYACLVMLTVIAYFRAAWSWSATPYCQNSLLIKITEVSSYVGP